MITTLLFAALPWTVPPLALQEDAPATRPATEVTAIDLAKDFAALEAELEAAIETWWGAYDAHEAAGTEPADYPGEAFRPRFGAIAEQGLLGAQIWMMDNSDWEDSVGRLKWCERALMEHSEDEGLVKVFRGLTWSFGPDDREFFAVLAAFSEKTELPSYKLAANATRGLILCEGNEKQRTKGLGLLKELNEVESDFPGKKAIAKAIFIAENLQIGMIAPDFDAVDVDGEPISLSDYRGKVTVVDFWGFW
jgi:hypothetical protein